MKLIPNSSIISPTKRKKRRKDIPLFLSSLFLSFLSLSFGEVGEFKVFSVFNFKLSFGSSLSTATLIFSEFSPSLFPKKIFSNRDILNIHCIKITPPNKASKEEICCILSQRFSHNPDFNSSFSITCY